MNRLEASLNAFVHMLESLFASHPAARETVAGLEAENAALTKERNDLRRQLQRIRIAHGPLDEAIYPTLTKEK